MLKHPVAIIGANGFIGRHLMRLIPGAIPVIKGSPINYKYPKTIFNVAGYCGKDVIKTLESNVYLVTDWLRNMSEDAVFINAGSSMEYSQFAAPEEDSHVGGGKLYGSSKSMASSFIAAHGAMGVPCANLRLYCVYGEGDRPTNLIPTVIREGRQGRLPPFVRGHTTRDFIHVEDVCRAFILAATNLKPENYGESFNIGTGVATPIHDVARMASEIFNVAPSFTREMGENDHIYWYANTKKSEKLLGFKAGISFEQGFSRLCA